MTMSKLDGPVIAKYLSCKSKTLSKTTGQAEFARAEAPLNTFTTEESKSSSTETKNCCLEGGISNSKQITLLNGTKDRASSIPCRQEHNAVGQHRKGGKGSGMTVSTEPFIPAWRRKASRALEQAKKNKKGKATN